MQRILPQSTPLTEPYWKYCRDGELRLQHCAACRRAIHFPQAECPSCGCADLTWEVVPGEGTVHTFSVVHRSFAPGYTSHPPYVIAWVEIAGRPGTRVFGNVLGIPPEEVRIGLPVELEFENLEGFGPLPNFRPSHGAG